MSAYIVENKTINRILAGLRMSLLDRNFKFPELFGELEHDGSNEKLEFLGKRMRDMNEDAVEQRYGEGTVKKDGVPPYQYEYIMCPDRIQLLKSLDCFIYQCTEGDVPEKQQLFNDLLKYADQLAHFVLYSTEEYEKSEWG